MWTRAEVKERGKASFRANYWKSVVVALLLMIVLSAGAGVSAPAGSHGTYLNATGQGIQAVDPDVVSGILEGGNGTITIKDGEDEVTVQLGEDANSVKIADDDGKVVEGSLDEIPWFFWPAATAAAILGALFTLAFALSIGAFICNPVEVGCRNFFLGNLHRQAEVREVATAFDHNYLNGVKTMFLRFLFTLLWTLLLIIPGIVKAYEYRMIPYLIAEQPEMDYKQAFAESKQMMHGNKWKAFVLDLSFLGWFFLSVLTLGLLGVFYVNPYYDATWAALYEELRYGSGLPPFAQVPAHAA